MAFRKITGRLHHKNMVMMVKEERVVDPLKADPSVSNLAFKPIPGAKKKKTSRKGETPKGVRLA